MGRIFFVFVFAACFLGLATLFVVPPDRQGYEELVMQAGVKSVAQECRQQRVGVLKQIYLGERLFEIESESSALVLSFQGGVFSAHEEFPKVRCIFEEKDGVQTLVAERADYDYVKRLFIADDVQLWRYDLDERLELRGRAQQVQFSFEETMRMHADKLRVVFDRGEKA